ncbi:MAG: hypothetical protein QJT81_15910 [Candidatus Thiothrix putei]|uniref:Uncharacterized protein n=1 Tax=Candidatus Thiothrix putei TaxID=3080811 RepID=A0AA95H9G6_9GAMM|nr:MAG: hypothetical protein QJT81_15910 [Candidatus Thiothrix putei]
MKQANFIPSAYCLLLLSLLPLSGCEQRDSAPPPAPPVEAIAEPVIIPDADKLQPDNSTAIVTSEPETMPTPPEKSNTLKIPKLAQQTLPNNEFSLRFRATGESFYTEINLENGILNYTYFEDTDGRCAQWVKSTPCWQEEDLKTISLALRPEDLDNLYAVIKESGALALKRDTFGGAKAGQRHYTQILEIMLDGKEKTLVYQSFPGASPKPEAFARLETALLEYARDLPH